LREVRSDLEGMGYVVEAGLFEAAEVGATHQRQRLFILAYSKIGNGRLSVCGRTEGQACADSSGGGESLADTGCSKRGAAAHGPGTATGSAEPGTERTGEIVAGAEHLSARAGGEGIEGEPAGHRRRGSSDGSAELADAGGAGCADAEPGRDARDGSVGEYELPLFPPGPGDLDGWRAVIDATTDETVRRREARLRAKVDRAFAEIKSVTGLEGEPPAHIATTPLEPAICGVADGLASRVDRLSMLGNGVVPLEAAYAFATLLARLRSDNG